MTKSLSPDPPVKGAGNDSQTPNAATQPQQGKPDLTSPVNTSTKPADAKADSDGDKANKRSRKSTKNKTRSLHPNNVRKLRMEHMMSKAELARRAGISSITLDRVERGKNCRMDTKRKILEALGLKPQDRKVVFPQDD